MRDELRQVLDEYALLTVSAASLDPHDNLYEKGMTSHASVNVMLALEERFDIEFPDYMLTRAAFATIADIERSVAELLGVNS
ncbi:MULTISPECIES: acyl carrier protein [Actinoplanes]|uniref:acyl carrier protein n=1 Tax=Actinoplanes TaxID=1865 RepID=UPI0005F2A518|nr:MULTISPECIES: acyl carrier protein [Actinoplanes]GLY02723.1 aminoacyl carrier protein [Actinoplanes sp. NBRC 101535]